MYGREHFLTYPIGTRLRLEIAPDCGCGSPLEQIARIFRLRTIVTGELVDAGPDALLIDPRPLYAVARDPRGGTPFMGKLETRISIAYDRILHIDPC